MLTLSWRKSLTSILAIVLLSLQVEVLYVVLKSGLSGFFFPDLINASIKAIKCKKSYVLLAFTKLLPLVSNQLRQIWE